MSFADAVRNDLLTVPIRKNCCRRAFIGGLFISALPDGGENGQATARFRAEAIAELGAEQLHIQFAKIADRRRVGSCGRYYEEVSFSSPAFRKLLESLRRPTPDPSETLGFRCEECRSAFLRGLFLSGGTINDPHKPVHLEFTAPIDTKETIAAFFEGIGYPAKTVMRGNKCGFYFKESAAVEDLMALMGAHRVIFDVINTRIECEIRNHENRVNNCDTRNLERTVSAAARQMNAIERLRETGKLDNLPEELRVTARLRYENPDFSLDALADLHNPPITKSGLNHRLRRITEAADDL